MPSFDVVDVLLVFWVVVAIATCIIGNFLDNYIKTKKALFHQKRHPSESTGSLNRNSFSYNNQQKQFNQQELYNRGSIIHESGQTYRQSSKHPIGLESSHYHPGTDHSHRNSHSQTYGYGGTGGGYSLGDGYGGINDRYYPSDYPSELTSGPINSTSSAVGHQRPNSRVSQSLNDDQSIPTATGFNTDCVEWINKILYLFYSEPNKYIQILSESLCRSLNEKLSNLQSSQQSSMMLNANTNNSAIYQLVFRDVVRESSSKPELTNVRTETESEKSVSTICKIYNRRLVFDLTVSISYANQPSGQQPMASAASLYDGYDPMYHGQAYHEEASKESILYELYLENLEGKLKSVSILQDKLMVVQFMERPNTKITLRPKYDTIQTMKQHSAINEDAVISLVMQTLTQVVVDLYFGDDPEFPRFTPQKQHGYGGGRSMASEMKKQIKQDFFSVLTKGHRDKGVEKEKKIFIKINKAVNINYNNGVYCLIEVDEPSQRSHTAVKQGSEPIWDEHFIFNLNDKSDEMLFELWDGVPSSKKNHDRKKDKFLGMAIVSMDELQKNPVQKQMLTLQSRPLESDNIGGHLHVEFLFMEHSAKQAAQYQKGDVISIDRKVTPSGFVITTTTITKPSSAAEMHSKSVTLPRDQSHGSNKDDQSNVVIHKIQRLSPGDENSLRAPSSLSTTPSDLANNPNYDGTSDIEINVPVAGSGRRSRPAERSQSILRAIKKRFSFSKTRSKSVEQRTGRATATSSASVSRASSIGSTDRAKSMPASRDPLPSIVINPGRSVDAVSEITYTHPSSQLIIESNSDGILRHYVVPPSLAKKSKWRKKGTKIHLYNDHQFIARHLSGPTTCHLCGRVFSRRPGKQGYMCRNCHVISHKQCHVKIDHMCPYGTRNTMILEYVDANKKKKVRKSSSRGSNVLSNARSVSMEVEDDR